MNPLEEKKVQRCPFEGIVPLLQAIVQAHLSSRECMEKILSINSIVLNPTDFHYMDNFFFTFFKIFVSVIHKRKK